MMYRYEWVGPNTGREYRLDFYTGGATELEDYPLGATMLNADAISGIDGWEWDIGDWPVGMVSPLRRKVTFRAQNIPSTMQAWIRTTTTIAIDIDDDISVNVDVGMLSIFWAEDSGGVLRIASVGIMDVGQDVTPDLKTGALTVEFTDVVQAAGKALRWEAIREADIAWARDNHVNRRGLYERLWRHGSGNNEWAYVGHVAPRNTSLGEDGSRFWFVTRDGLYARWQGYMLALIRGMTRLPDATFVLPLAAMRAGFRKQSYVSETPGAALANESIYIFFAVTSHDNADATVNFTWHDEIKQPCFWDWLVDYADEVYYPVALTYTGQSVPNIAVVHPPVLDETTAVDYTHRASDVKPSLRTKVLLMATGSTENGVRDDYSSAEAPTRDGQGGRNDRNDTIVVVTRSSPVICDYIRATDQNSRHAQATGLQYSATIDDKDPRAVGYVAYQYYPRFGGYYYFERPSSSIWATEIEMPIRCHSWTPIDNPTVPTFGPASQPSIPFDTVDGKAIGVKAWAIADQQTWGILNDIAKAHLSTFGNRNGSKLAFTCDITDLAWRPLLHAVTFDLTAHNAIGGTWLDGAPDTWHATKATMDMLNERMTVECYGQ